MRTVRKNGQAPLAIWSIHACPARPSQSSEAQARRCKTVHGSSMARPGCNPPIRRRQPANNAGSAPGRETNGVFGSLATAPLPKPCQIIAFAHTRALCPPHAARERSSASLASTRARAHAMLYSLCSCTGRTCARGCPNRATFRALLESPCGRALFCFPVLASSFLGASQGLPPC